MSRELFGQTDHGAKDSVDDDDDGDAKQIKLVNEVIVVANAKVPPKAVCAMYVLFPSYDGSDCSNVGSLQSEHIGKTQILQWPARPLSLIR